MDHRAEDWQKRPILTAAVLKQLVDETHGVPFLPGIDDVLPVR